VPAVSAVPIFSEVEAHLVQKLDDLQDLHRNHSLELAHAKSDIAKLKAADGQLASELLSAKRRYTYFQELKTYVDSLVEFLDTKVCCVQLYGQTDADLGVIWLD
jgi:hypothetical protein